MLYQVTVGRGWDFSASSSKRMQVTADSVDEAAQIALSAASIDPFWPRGITLCVQSISISVQAKENGNVRAGGEGEYGGPVGG